MQKIAVYCRVSTDKEDQAHSFESQQLFFREYIQRQPGWELYRIYADEGLSGTSTQKRTAFLQMLQDAQQQVAVNTMSLMLVNCSPQKRGYSASIIRPSNAYHLLRKTLSRKR